MVNKISPNVSVIIPVFNGTNYLREAIDCVLAQTYRNYEILVIDDGSTDGTWELIKSYGESVRSLRKPNGGVASALNLGIKEMRGQWFAWLSHDDLFSKDRLNEDMLVAKSNPDAKVIFCKANIINANGEIIQEEKSYPVQHVNSPRDVLLLSGMNMCTMTIHKSCFEKIGLFNEMNQTTQDVEMNLRLSKNFQFYHNNKSVTSTRQHLSQGTLTLTDQHKKDILELSNFIHKEFTINDFFPNIKENEKTKALIWIGDQYLNFGALQYANESYNFAVKFQKNWVKRFLIAIYIKLRKQGFIRKAYIMLCYFGSIMKTRLCF